MRSKFSKTKFGGKSFGKYLQHVTEESSAVAQSCNLGTWVVRQEDPKLELSVGYTEKYPVLIPPPHKEKG